MTQFGVRVALDAFFARGVGAVRVAVEPGEVSRGKYISCKTSPQIICCLDGEARYFIRRGGREKAVVLSDFDVLIVAGGAWLGVAPERPYTSLGILLYPEITHGYIMHPAREGETAPESGMIRPFARGGNPRDGDPFFTHTIHTAVRNTTAVAGPEHLAMVRALVAAAGRAPDDPLLGALATALLVGCRQLLDAEPAEAHSKGRATYEAVCAEISRRCDEPLDRRTVADALRIHPNHLTKLFAEFSNTTPNATHLTPLIRKTGAGNPRRSATRPSPGISWRPGCGARWH